MMWVSLVLIRNGVYKAYFPHKRYKLHSTKSTIHTRGIHRRPWFGCDDEQVRQCNDGMVTSTFTSFVFAKRFIEVEALYLQSQNSFAQLECDSCEPWAGVKETPYLLTQNSFAELECEPCEPWAGLKCTSDTVDSCSQILNK